jgi:hypothetical protein
MTDMETSTRPHEIASGVAALAPSASRKGTAEERKAGKGIYQVLFEGLRKHPRLRVFLSECRSVLHRSHIVLTNSDAHRVPMGFGCLESSSGRTYRNTRSLACIQDIERISSNRPWATPLDWTAYPDSWDAGAEWALSTFDTSLDSEHKALLVSTR